MHPLLLQQSRLTPRGIQRQPAARADHAVPRDVLAAGRQRGKREADLARDRAGAEGFGDVAVGVATKPVGMRDTTANTRSWKPVETIRGPGSFAGVVVLAIAWFPGMGGRGATIIGRS
jgi:hypothetical protein